MTPGEHAIYLAGPTASGKSAAALELAERIGGEIVSVDSMQVYRGLDIGTAKPGLAERQRVPHHLIDVVELDGSFDAARYVQLARAAASGIRARGRTPVFCGGTGLYFNALAGGLAPGAAPDPALRRELEATPLPRLLEELQAGDPETFQRIDRKNPRRVIRAVELLRTGAGTIRESRPDWAASEPDGIWFGIRRGRADLNGRIDRRVDQMFAAGLVRETRQLIERGLDLNRTATQAIGYRQVIDHLAGVRDLPSTIAMVKQKTRQYAKRQMTWFRRQLNLAWIDAAPATTAAEIAAQIAETISAKKPRDNP